MNSKTIKILLVFLFGTALIIGSAFAEGEGGGNKNRLNKPDGAPIRAFMNINNISTVIKNTGISDIDVGESNSGLVFPKGSGKQAVFISGLIWGAMIEGDPQVRVGGSTYSEGLQGGAILSDGTVEDANAPHVRIYRVRPTVFPGGPDVDVSVEANDEGLSESDVRAQYETDWTEWPATFGAPYYDGDGNGMYDAVPNPVDSLRDIPGVKGADQTIWYVANDTESGLTFDLYGTAPLGIEYQATFWAYAQTGALGNMYFRKYVLINKTDVWGSAGPQIFHDMYISMWSDPDIGNSVDDFAGSDTVLSLSFAYNALANDPTYNPLPPPAIGFDFFQGPLLVGVAGEDRNNNGVDDASDFAIFNGQDVGPGFINLPMTAAYYFARGDPSVTDPTLQSSAGADQFYNFFQGKIGLTGNFFVNPITGLETPFTLTGDPQTGTGWVDGLLIGPADRRIGMAAGPFDMAPGDTQEVVIAEICAGAIPGVDRLSAIGLLKFYDQVAQVAYDNFFDLPVPPPAPSLTVTELDREIVLDWSKDNDKVLATESFDEKEYSFQGYNVYQLPNAAASTQEGVRLATFDLNDGVGKIDDAIFDPTIGSVVKVPVQFGNDTGIKRFISITSDRLKGNIPLINGIRYYFAVTAYNYNPDPNAIPNNLENPIQIFTVIPNSNDPGVTFGEGTGSELEMTHEGSADGGPTVTIVDPTTTTGNTYEVFFNIQQQIRDEDGFWVPAATILRKSAGPDSLDQSTVDIAGVFGSDGASTDLQFHLEVIHHAGGWADGVTLKFPGNVVVLAAPAFEAQGGTITPEIIPFGDSTIINMGLVNHEYTGDGFFHEGGEDWVITVASFDPPLSVDWTVYDDGWPDPVEALDAVGTTTVTEIGFAMRTAELWNLRNNSTGVLKLENISVIDGTDLYPPRDDLPTNPGVDAAPIVDGFQINLAIGYAAPLTIGTLTLNGDPISSNSNPPYGIQDFTVFGVVPATAANSNLGIGTSELELLQKDYEIRYTADVTEIQNIGGVNVEVTVSGGSIATLYGARGYDIAIHPLNPNPGSSDPFTIRIPFEVWSIDDDKQINFMVYDRIGDPTADDPFRAWNTTNRMYTAFVLSDYQETAIPLTDPSLSQFATWNLVWWVNDWESGDVVQVFYDNPVVPGTDTYQFTTTASAFSSGLAASQVNEINVFPNPYYGINSEELNKYNRFVTFTHLPENAKIRIFNLAGVLVKTIDKSGEGQTQRWDLANDAGLPVASGLYIAYIELSDLGETKILKVAIIQEQQILDRF